MLNIDSEILSLRLILFLKKINTVSILKYLIRFSKKENYILFDNLYEPSAEAVDAYALFEYIRKYNKNTYYILWKKNPLYEELKNKKKLKNVILLNDSCAKNKMEFVNKAFFQLLKAKNVISSNGLYSKEIEKLLCNAIGVNYIFIDHGKVFLKPSIFKNGYLFPSKFNKFLVSCEKEAKIFEDNGFPKDKILFSGLPRWDNLKAQETKFPEITMFFTWRHSFLFNKNYKTSVYYKKISELLDSQKFNDLIRQNNIKVNLYLHHSISDLCNVNMQFNNKNIRVNPPGKISQNICRSKLLITDYSSIFSDFLFSNKPVLFYRLDEEDKNLCIYDQEDLEHAKSMDKYLFNVFNELSDMLNKLDYYIKNNYQLEDEYKKKAEKLFCVRKNIKEDLYRKLEQL